MGTIKFKIYTYALSCHSKYDDTNVVSAHIGQEVKCSLCLYLYNDPVILATCRHAFCRSCISNWFCNIKSCPLCRNTGNFKDIIDPPKDLLDTMRCLVLRCQNCNGHIPLNEIELHEARCFALGRITKQEHRPTNQEEGSNMEIIREVKNGASASIKHYPGYTLTLSPKVGLFNLFYTNGHFSNASSIENELIDQIVSQSSSRIMKSSEWDTLYECPNCNYWKAKAFWKIITNEIGIAQTDLNDSLGPLDGTMQSRMHSAEKFMKRIAKRLERLILKQRGRIYFKLSYEKLSDFGVLKICGTFTH